CAALPELLARVDLAGWSRSIAALRTELHAILSAAGLDPRPSDANFVLCANARGLRERLARHGVLVRDCASFGLVDHARVAVPDEAGLARLARALADTAEGWDRRYAATEQRWSGLANRALVAEVEHLEPGRALDVGCGEGADAVWLARRGWSVTAVDIS